LSALYSTIRLLNTATGKRGAFKQHFSKLQYSERTRALYSNTVGKSNCSIGVSALYYNTTGAYTAVGVGALQDNISGGFIQQIGYAPVTLGPN